MRDRSSEQTGCIIRCVIAVSRFHGLLGIAVCAVCALSYAIFEVLTAVLLKIHVLLDMALCILVHR
jgi:hypothetical protein